MEIYPFLQFSFLLAAFAGGVFLGAASEIGKVLRVLLGGHQIPDFMQARYQKPLPFIHVCVKRKHIRKWKLAWQRSMTFLFDFGFCMLCAFVAVYILYRFHDGEFRLIAIVCLLAGLFLWRRLFAKISSYLVAWLAFLLSAFWLYFCAVLCLPFLVMRRLIVRIVYRPLSRLFVWLHDHHTAHLSDRLCRRQLAFAACGFRRDQKVKRKVKSWQNTKKAVKHRS